MHRAEQQPIFLSVVLDDDDEDEKEDADVDNSEVTKLVL